MPIAYLYRHCLELKMKHLIRLGKRLDLIEEDERLRRTFRKHHLYSLWNTVKTVITQFDPDCPIEDLKAAEKIVQEIHNIDRSGQSLRYSADTSGRATVDQLPESVDLRHLRDVFEAIFNFLDGCECGLDHALEVSGEMWADYMGP